MTPERETPDHFRASQDPGAPDDHTRNHPQAPTGRKGVN